MKKSTHYLLKLLVLTLFLNLTNCSKDEDYQINDQQVKSESKVLVKKISRQEVYSNPVLANNLSKYCGEKSNNQIKGEEYSNANSKIIYNSDLNIAINDQVANFLQSTDGSYHSYTFNVINYNDLSAKSNLLLSLQPDGSYLEVLINYDLSDQQLEAFNTTGLLPENVEITSQLLENGTFTTSLFAKTLVLGTECGGIEYGNVNSSICTAGGNHVWTQRFDCQGYPGPNGPTPGSDYTVSFDLDCLIENAGSDSTLDSDTTSEGENQEQEDNGGVLDGPNNLDNPNDDDNDENYNPDDINNHGNEQSVPLFDGSLQSVSGPFTSFLSGLSPELQDFINSPSNIFIKINIGDFLTENNHSDDSKAFSNELLAVISQETIVDYNALNFMLDAKTQNKIYNSFDYAFLNSVNQYMSIDTSDAEMTDPLTLYFKMRCIALRAAHPDWSNIKIYWEASKDLVHFSLDTLGLIPFFGEPADIINGIIYTFEGDALNATLSYSGAVPIAGWLSTSAKISIKVLNQTTQGVIGLVFKVSDSGLISFGDRNILKHVIGSAGTGLHAHHIIPWDFRNHDLVQKAANSAGGFNMNEAINGIPLPSGSHLNGHPSYSTKVNDILDNINVDGMDNDEAYTVLSNFINYLDNLINSNQSLNLGEVSELINYP
ncbi:AHH domain-containing protein [Olleya marilimosa]|uniref:AHH domain-containing protein n=1 Tax=Olleya marilimosa TaxID=272164 RepID=UPI0004845003|nr:AHH domain-containing protein [Olleya marilimosa]